MARDNNNGANLGFERELWQAADRQCQLCLGPALHPPPRPDRPSRVRSGQRIDVFESVWKRAAKLDQLVWANLEDIGYGK